MNYEILLAVMSCVACACFILERRLAWATHISGVCLIILVALILANLGFIPTSHALYDFFSGPVIPIAIALLVFTLDFRDVVRLPRKLAAIWVVGAFASFGGAIISAVIAARALGTEDAAKLAAQLAASYIGGGENSVAMKSLLGIPNELFVGCFAVDNLVTSIWMVCTVLFARSTPHEYSISEKTAEEHDAQKATLVNILASFTLAFFIHGASVLASKHIGFLHPILYLGILALVIGQIPMVRRMVVPSYLLGSLIFAFFFFSIGAISDLRTLAHIPPAVVAMPFIVVTFHALVIYGVAVLLKVSSMETSLASQALIGGPATAVALAQIKNWKSGISLGLVIGVLGYATANYFGMATYHLSIWLINVIERVLA